METFVRVWDKDASGFAIVSTFSIIVVIWVVVTWVTPADDMVVGMAVIPVDKIVVGNIVGARVAACSAPEDKNVATAAFSLVTNV